MAAKLKPEIKTQRRIEKLVRLANRGKEDELRAEFVRIHGNFLGTRQALDQRLRSFGTLAARPPMPDGSPMGTMGYQLLLTIKNENPSPATWIPKILDALINRKKTTAVTQALEWLLSPEQP